MAHAGFLNVRKNGKTLRVPLFTDRTEATPSDCPAFCVRRAGAAVYAAVSSLPDNAAAAFRRNARTFYLVTGHTRADVASWITVFSKTSGGAASFALPAEYAFRPVLLQCAGGQGAEGGLGANEQRTYKKTSGSIQTPIYEYCDFNIYGGLFGSGGYGSAAETFAGVFESGAVFSVTRADGGAGAAGAAGMTPSSTGRYGFAGGAGGNGGAGGVGFKISAANAHGQQVSCTGYGGGGGGGGGGHGGCGENTMNVYGVQVPKYTYPTGTGGRGGSCGGTAGQTGIPGEAGDSAHGRRIGLEKYTGYDTRGFVSYGDGKSAPGEYGNGGDGASGGTSENPYAYIKIGVLK